MRGRFAIGCRWIGVCLALLGIARARADNLFDIRGKPAEHGWVTVEHALPAVPEPSSPMLRSLAGIIGELTGPQIKSLRACIEGPSKKIDGLDEAPLVCVLHLTQGKDELTVEIRRTETGVLVARRGMVAGEDQRQGSRTERLSDEKFFRLARGWSLYRGPFDPPTDGWHGGSLAQLTPPVHGWFLCDKGELSERLLHGRQTRIEGTTRKLVDVELWARAPANYDAKAPAGLLVWVNPSPNGQPPATLFPIADELGMVCVSQADSGNECPIGDRYQRVFDAVATATSRFHIDPRRIYIAGLSGGGKVSSVLWACYPDVFSGCVPIVGLACYENVPIGNGQVWPGLFNKPEPALFTLAKTQRVAAITGPKDFNYDSIQGAAKVLTRDGLDVKIFEYDDMGHQMPTADRFALALRWIDESYQATREKEIAAARAALAEATKSDGAALSEDKKRDRLVEVTRTGPWTPAAWEAAALLNQPKP